MPIGSQHLAPAELDGYQDERLLEELKRSKEELFNLRFQLATGQLDNNVRIKAVKRDIARIYTVIRERELGIRQTPEVEAAPEKKSRKKKADQAESESASDTTEEA